MAYKLPKSLRIRLAAHESKRRNVGGIVFPGSRTFRDRKNDYSRQAFKAGRR